MARKGDHTQSPESQRRISPTNGPLKEESTSPEPSKPINGHHNGHDIHQDIKGHGSSSPASNVALKQKQSPSTPIKAEQDDHAEPSSPPLSPSSPASSSSVPFSPPALDLGSAAPSPQRRRRSRHQSPDANGYELTPVTTALPSRRKKKAAAALSHPPQLINDLPRADDEALSTFVRLDENWYANRHIGRGKGHEQGLVCECNYRPGRDDLSKACTDEAGCINRLTQVECLSKDCRCADHCQNQRFQKRQYADVEIVKTDKKGYGLRAAESIPAESFVYEYIGEVVDPEDFHKRMRRYHDERIPHFYFMMLQKDEYLDATKKGGIARFINHSCNPNCYVAKWQVGKHMRMGIFAQRDVQQGEELTFNYNVDRYGNEAQPCYCGEPNCVGQLGGKTQTDIGGMSNLYIEALGIVDEVERLQARGSKKQKSRILDEDFNPTLHPLEEDETSTVATAIRQAANNRSILMKLLQRIQMTDDVAVHKRFVRLHGFVLMVGVLTEWKDDSEIILSCMVILAKWPLIARNKVVDTGVEAIVEDFRSSKNPDISSLASELYDAWQKLSLEFRIARKEGADEDMSTDVDDDIHARSRRRRGDDEDDSHRISERMDEALDAAQAPNDVSKALEQVVPRPLGKFNGVPIGPGGGARKGGPDGTPNRFNNFRGGSGAGWWNRAGPPFGSAGPTTPQTPDGDPRQQMFFGSAGTPLFSKPSSTSTMSIEEIIRRANESQASAAAKAAEESTSASARDSKSPRKDTVTVKSSSSSSRDKTSSSSKKRKSKSNGDADNKKHRTSTNSSSSSADSTDKARKRLSSLIGEIVVRTMSKKTDQRPLNDKDSFKRHAREATEVLVNKEMKRLMTASSSSSAAATTLIAVPEKISTEKKEKIKVFVAEYADKIVARHAAKNNNKTVAAAEGSVGGTEGASPGAAAGTTTPSGSISSITQAAP